MPNNVSLIYKFKANTKARCGIFGKKGKKMSQKRIFVCYYSREGKISVCFPTETSDNMAFPLKA